MNYLPNILFLTALFIAFGFFAQNVKRLRRNILLGKDINVYDNPKQRFKNLLMIAFGQSKMVKRPLSGILHLIVYIGFIIINIEMLEIIYDGLIGTHRAFAFLGGFYNFLIAAFEILAALVIISVIAFWLRRNIHKVRRLIHPELNGWPKNDANYILYIELVLMTLFLTMNAADYTLQQAGAEGYIQAGSFPVSGIFVPLFNGMEISTVILVERTAWWLHILGILLFLNYLYYSKHLHILLAFPNTYFGKLVPKGKFPNNNTVTKEVKLMMDPNADPFSQPVEGDTATMPEKFGASDVTDLNWVQLLNAYTCTECGRCTSECPANQTGKKLSPRKIMMDTRDRLEEVGKNIDKNGQFVPDGKQLLDDYITREELWACTTCNACVEACPVSIDPLSIIMDMRQYLVMEQSAAPNELNVAMTNIENNGAPWPYNQMDRLNWKNE